MKSKRTRKKDTIKFLTAEECKELFEKIESDTSRLALRNKAIFYVAKYCALRASEVALLTTEDYNIVSSSIYCHRLKGSKDNTLEIVDPYVRSLMYTYYMLRIQIHSDYDNLFLSQKGGPISRKMLDVLIKHYCDNTSIPLSKRHFHVLRHTRAIELIECPGVDIRDTQWYLGHKSIRSTLIYLDYTSTAMQRLFDQLAMQFQYKNIS